MSPSLSVIHAQGSLIQRLKVNYEKGTFDNDREVAAQRRHANLEAKMHRTPTNGGHRAVGTAVPIHELQAVRSSQGIGSPSQLAALLCAVYYACRRSDSAKQIDQVLGTGVIPFPETSTMLGTLSLLIVALISNRNANCSTPIEDCQGGQR